MWRESENGKAIMLNYRLWKDSQELCSHPSVKCIQREKRILAYASQEKNGITMESLKP